MTNIEKIQSMSATELSGWLYQVKVCTYTSFCLDKDCKKCIKRWLESECEDEDY